MNKSRSPKGNSSPSPDKTESASTPPPRGQRRIWLLTGILLFLAFITAGVYTFRARGPKLPEIPAINLDGADPEVVIAVQAARDEVTRSPRSIQAWGEMAALTHANGFDAAADICYDAAMKLDPQNSLWPYLRGYLHHTGAAGPLAALPYFERAAELSNSTSPAQMRLADTLLELGRLDEAEREYLKVQAADKRDPRALFGLGKVAIARGQFQDSLKFLLPIARNRLVQHRACSARASVYERLGNHSEAERERRQLAKLPEDQMWPDDPIQRVIEREIGIQALMRTGQMLWHQNRVDEVLNVARKAVEKYPDSDVAWGSLGTVLIATNDPLEAEQAIQKAISLAPNTAEHRVSLGKLQLSQKRYQDAEQTLRSALQLDSHDGQTHFSLGECLVAQGNRTAAIESYRKALKLDPELASAQERLKELEQNP